jgi:hypothetical protein
MPQEIKGIAIQIVGFFTWIDTKLTKKSRLLFTVFHINIGIL